MTSCRPASVRADHTSTCRRVGGTMRANDTVSRCIDSTTGTLFATVGMGTSSLDLRRWRIRQPPINVPPVTCQHDPRWTGYHPRRDHPARLPGHTHTHRTGRLRDTTTNHPSRQHRATTRTPEPCPTFSFAYRGRHSNCENSIVRLPLASFRSQHWIPGVLYLWRNDRSCPPGTRP